MASLGEATLQSGFDASGMLKDMQRARRRTEGFLGGWGGALKTAFSTALGFLGAQVIGGIVRGLKDIARAGFEIVTSFEQTGVAFRTMLGDAQLALGVLRDLADFAATTPFELAEVEKGARQLLAMGSSANELIPELRMLGDVSAGLSVPLERLIINYGQVRTQNKLTGREMRDFLIAGVPLVDALADVLGVAKGEIAGMVSEGKVGFADVQQAFANMTSEGGKFHDLMQEQSLTTAGRISNLKDRITILAREMGAPLLGGVNKIIDAFSRLAATFGPGGSMHRASMAVTAFASLVLESIGNAASGAVDHVEEMGESIANRFISMAERALRWGVNVVGQFAVGMIRGATQALTAALNFISRLLTFWMSPGSPPKFLPNIDKWGTAAFTEFLRGFSSADFGILSNLQRPIKAALQNVESLAKSALDPDDKLGAAALAGRTTEVYASLSAGIAEAIDLAKRTGQVNKDILGQVAAATGKFGDEIARTLKLELQMVSATKRLEEAQNRLTAAQGKRTEATNELGRLRAELMLAHQFGRGTTVIEGLEREVELAEKNLSLAKDEEKSAASAVEQHSDKEGSLESQLDAQRSLVSQLLDMESMQIDPFVGMKDALKGAGESVKDLAESVESIFAGMGDVAPLGDSLDTAFGEMKERIRKAWADMIGDESDPDSLAGRWAAFVDNDIPKLGEAFDNLKLAVDGFTNSEGIQTLMAFFGIGGEGGGLDPGKIGQIAGNLLIFGGALSLIGGFLGPKSALGSGLKWLAFTAIPWVLTALGSAIISIAGFFGLVVTLPAWAVGLVAIAIAGLIVFIISKWDEFEIWWRDFAGRVRDALPDGFSEMADKLAAVINNEIQPRFERFVTWVKNLFGIGSPSRVFRDIGSDIVQGLWNGLKSKWSEVKSWWEGVIRELEAIWRRVTQTQSPSKVYQGLGGDLVKGIQSGAEMAVATLPNPVMPAYTPTPRQQPQQPRSGRSVNIGTVNIHEKFDFDKFGNEMKKIR